MWNDERRKAEGGGCGEQAGRLRDEKLSKKEDPTHTGFGSSGVHGSNVECF